MKLNMYSLHKIYMILYNIFNVSDPPYPKYDDFKCKQYI